MTDNAAAISKSIFSGMGLTLFLCANIFSHIPPTPVAAKTLSPTLNPSTPSPISITTPADSPPGIKGSGG